jgi:hypothetical protein
MPPQPVRDSNPNYRVVQTTSSSMSSLMCCTSTRSQKAMTYKECSDHAHYVALRKKGAVLGYFFRKTGVIIKQKLAGDAIGALSNKLN